MKELEGKAGQHMMIECDCRIKNAHVVILQPSLDPKMLSGTCSNCHKVHVRRRNDGR